ncbi:MAG: hypothetical protein II267_03925 [Paludibacteraceae bacterium]|nr:hypothetical protein [Paludibacteraceae bacterium]MBQ2439021.1 hypothetical protein [Paludibacteraceae bacterium]
MIIRNIYSGIALTSAVILSAAAVAIEPMGVIDTSILYVVAQLLIYSASLLGISSAVNAISKHIKSISNQPCEKSQK